MTWHKICPAGQAQPRWSPNMNGTGTNTKKFAGDAEGFLGGGTSAKFAL
jgi:hypothetical protein